MATDTKTKTAPSGHRIKRILKLYEQTAERTLNGPDGNMIASATAAAAGAAEVNVDRCCRNISNSRPLSRDCARGPWKRSSRVSGVDDYVTEEKKVLVASPQAAMSNFGKSDIVETNLEGHKIACFEVGGEQRLCMPQILSTVLRDFDPNDVLSVCEELHIFFSLCDSDQLESLKRGGVLPHQIETCGLITLTNAERICSNLLRNEATYKCRLPIVLDGLKVYHECFGGCKGVFMLEGMNTSSKCIQCAECGSMLTLQQFVCHSHSKLENGTIHWGFDPANWRSYLMLSPDQGDVQRAQEFLDELKDKFQDEPKIKSLKQEVEDETPNKRSRFDHQVNDRADNVAFKWVPADFKGAWKFCRMLQQQLESGKSRSGDLLPPHVHTDSPFLAEPDRVIPYSDAQWNDRNFAPNVSLDPGPYKDLHDMYDDPVEEKEEEEEEDSDCHGNGFKPMKQSLKRLCSTSPKSAFSTAVLSGDSGNISDDDSDDTESILSDKLPSVNNSNSSEICDKVSAMTESRLGLLIQVLEGKVQRSQSYDPMHDFMALQKQHSDLVSSLTDTNDTLLQRHRYLWSVMEERLHEMEEIRRSQDEELVRLKEESNKKMREATLERCRLLQQIEQLSNGSVDSDLARMATRYKEEAEHLKRELQSAEKLNSRLREEIAELHCSIDKFTRPKGGSGQFVPVVIKPEVGFSAGSGWHAAGSNPSSSSSSSSISGVHSV